MKHADGQPFNRTETVVVAQPKVFQQNLWTCGGQHSMHMEESFNAAVSLLMFAVLLCMQAFVCRFLGEFISGFTYCVP